MSDDGAAAAAPAPQPVAALAALEQTKRRVEALHAEARVGADLDDEGARRLYIDESVWAGWFPEEQSAFRLPHAYRDVTKLRDAKFVAEHMHGACLETHRALSPLDALLLKFVILRRLDVETAAVRIVAFRKLVIEHGLVWTYRHEDVRAGLALGAFHFVPVLEPQEGRPVVALFPRLIDYSVVDLGQVKRAWFFGMMTAMSWTPTAQTAGMCILNSLKDTGMASMNGEFRTFLMQAINHCLPVRVSTAFLANEPFIFGTLMWPLFKYALSEKIRSRMCVVGKDYARILAVLPPRCVPTEMGGERPCDDAETARITRLYDYTPLPTGTAPHAA